MDIRHINESYQALAKELISSEECLEYLRNSDVAIAFLSSEHEMKKNRRAVGGQCEKIPEKYKWAIPFDFTITVFEPNVERFTDDQMKVLLIHELLHVGIELDGNEEQYYVAPHDVEDFRTIIDKYGVDWSETE